MKRIMEASQNNALTFFVGAGVSAISGAPTWKNLINAISDQLGLQTKGEYSSDEYLQIPQMYYYSLDDNKEEYYKLIESKLNSSDLKPNYIHREMLNMNPISFITTNYDTLLEDAVAQYCQSFKVISEDREVPTIFGERFILKIHGDFMHKNFVLKEEDYLNYSENFKLIETLAKSIFSTNTVVFIGYSLNDYNIKLILNWAKALLKNDFKKPIFFYVGNHILTDAELKYHQSKGLSVVEWNKLIEPTCDFLTRYESLFSALRSQSQLSANGKTTDEAFNVLYKLLEPLNHLNTLRIGDVSKRLPSDIQIDATGTIYCSHADNLLLTKFFRINQMTKSEFLELPPNVVKAYQCIFSVFKKSRIFKITDEEKRRQFITENAEFADENCILFDYVAMRNFSEKTYMIIEDNYKKAFYLTRLNRYDEAFFLFSDVAKQAFKKKEYLLYYLAESNCISLWKIIRGINYWYHCYKIDDIEKLLPSDSEAENLFRHLPVDFQNKYDNLENIHSANMFYKYSFESFINGKELQKNIESESIEFGVGSCLKAICKIRESLHFLLGNGIIADEFSEYKVSIQNLMSILIYKLTTNGRKVLRGRTFPSFVKDEVHFDEIDFYCFINYFKAEDITALMRKYDIETIEFYNMELIENSVENILSYYEYSIDHKENCVFISKLQMQIQNCLALLKYINISQNLVDRICSFIFARGLSEMSINEKIQFLNRQLEYRKMYSGTTQKTVENALITYLDLHITALKKGENPDSNLGDYYCLANYISAPDENYYSCRLAVRIFQIIDNKLSEMYSHIAAYYCMHISMSHRQKLIERINEMICKEFNFYLFMVLVNCNSQITNAVKTKLKEFLKQRIDAAKAKKSSNKTIFSPSSDSYEELELVGCLCLLNVLKSGDFREFIGNSLFFDFCCEYAEFDFKQFEVSWLLNLYPRALNAIARDQNVKGNIRSSIASTLADKSIKSSERKKLIDILLKYFC